MKHFNESKKENSREKGGGAQHPLVVAESLVGASATLQQR